jgi:DNA replication protein DnaC
VEQELQQRIIKLLNITKPTGSPQTIKYECDICKEGKGWIVDSITNSAKACKCQEGNRYKDIINNSGITEAFRERTFNTYVPKNNNQAMAKKKAIEYSKDFENIRKERNNSIALLCQVGAGKTHLSIAIANALMQNNVGVRYMPFREDIIKLKQNINDDEFYQKEVNNYKNAPVLLIDDLFKGKITETDIYIMYEIINYRYLKSAPMIVSSEYSTDKLLDFDEAIGSRIIEMCKGRIFEFEGAELNHRLI